MGCIGMLGTSSAFLRWCAQAVIHFARAQRAAMAVEFALVAPIFIAVLVAMLQVAIFLFAQQVLQNAALEAGRLFMTGSAQSLTQAQFKSKVCPLVQ